MDWTDLECSLAILASIFGCFFLAALWEGFCQMVGEWLKGK
jgi:hypothetical protein